MNWRIVLYLCFISYSYAFLLPSTILRQFTKGRQLESKRLLYSPKLELLRHGSNHPQNTTDLQVSISSGGLLIFYMLGVSKNLLENYDLKRVTLCGSSAGSWISMAVALHTKENHRIIFDNLISDVISEFGNPVFTWFRIHDILEKKTLKYFPSDTLINTPVEIAVTQPCTFKHKLINNIRNLKDFINVSKASSNIPPFTHLGPIKYQNGSYIDGFFTMPRPVCDDKELILEIYPTMFGRKFTFWDAIFFNKEKCKKMFDLGYSDSEYFYRDKLKITI